MEHYGYMGTEVVKIDACSGCALLWLDAEELGTMSLLHAQTARRGAARREEDERTTRELERQISRDLTARIVKEGYNRFFKLGHYADHLFGPYPRKIEGSE
jgi:hypothetical protein